MTHVYAASLLWQGSTGTGVADYDRTHRGRTPPARPEFELSADPDFRGDPDLVNPEQLLLLAASSCQLLSFLAVAARDGMDVVEVVDDAEAELDVAAGRLTGVVLRPHVVVRGRWSAADVHARVRRAHGECFVAASLACPVRVEPTVEVRA